MAAHINFTFGHLNKAIFCSTLALVCLSCDFSEEFMLRGTHYEMCTYPVHTILYNNEIVIDDYVSALSWNQKYIIAYSRPSESMEEMYYYYIVEQCEPDEFLYGIFPRYNNRKPWMLEKFQTKQEFSDRITQLEIDTLLMMHWPNK